MRVNCENWLGSGASISTAWRICHWPTKRSWSTGEPMEERCGDCRECVDICPAGAFSGRAFSAQEPRDVRFDVQKCSAYFGELAEAGQPPVCGMCLYICPHGRTYRASKP